MPEQYDRAFACIDRGGAPSAREGRHRSRHGGGWRNVTRLVNIAAGAALIVILTSFTLASRLAYGAALAPQDLMAIRFATSGLLLLPFAIARRGWALLGLDSMKLAAAGGIGFATPAFIGLAIVPASHAGALLHGALPLFTFAIGFALGRTAADARRVTGICLVAAALAVIVWDSGGGGSGQQLGGAALILLASATWSGFGLLAARLKLEPVGTAATVGAWSAVLYLPPYLLFLEPQLHRADLAPVLTQVAVQGVLVGTISVFVYSWVVLRLGASGAAVCTALVPSATALAAMPLLSEHPTTTLAFALALLAGGSLLSSTGSSTGSRRGRERGRGGGMLTSSTSDAGMLSLVAFAVSATLTPGGATLLATASGARFGLRRSLPLLAGISVGLAALVALAGAGLGALLQAAPASQSALRAAGSAYLLWLAWQIARSGAPDIGQAESSSPMGFPTGIALLWLNPKGWTMALAASATYAGLGTDPVSLAALLGAVFGAAAALSLLVWCACGLLARTLRTTAAWRAVNAVLGAALAASVIPIWL